MLKFYLSSRFSYLYTDPHSFSAAIVIDIVTSKRHVGTLFINRELNLRLIKRIFRLLGGSLLCVAVLTYLSELYFKYNTSISKENPVLRTPYEFPYRITYRLSKKKQGRVLEQRSRAFVLEKRAGPNDASWEDSVIKYDTIDCVSR